jgi:hypothetical protein
MTPQRYRLLQGDDNASGTRDLDQLVDRGLAVLVGTSFWPGYKLSPVVPLRADPAPVRPRPVRSRGDRRPAIRTSLREHGPATRAAIQAMLGVTSASTVTRWLSRLIEDEEIDVLARSPTSPDQMYTLRTTRNRKA